MASSKKFYIAMLHAHGATVEECLRNALFHEGNIQYVLQKSGVASNNAASIRVPGADKVTMILKPTDDGWGLWYTYKQFVFERILEATDFGHAVLRQFRGKRRTDPKRFEVWQLPEKNETTQRDQIKKAST